MTSINHETDSEIDDWSIVGFVVQCPTATQHIDRLKLWLYCKSYTWCLLFVVCLSPGLTLHWFYTWRKSYCGLQCWLSTRKFWVKFPGPVWVEFACSHSSGWHWTLLHFSLLVWIFATITKICGTQAHTLSFCAHCGRPSCSSWYGPWGSHWWGQTQLPPHMRRSPKVMIE